MWKTISPNGSGKVELLGNETEIEELPTNVFPGSTAIALKEDGFDVYIYDGKEWKKMV